MKAAGILIALAATSLAQSCTVLIVARGGEVYAAANEDEANTPNQAKHTIKFVTANATKGTQGYVAFGYASNPFSDESALNEAGLFYDFTAQDPLDKANPGKPKAKFDVFTQMITRCKTVKEAVEFLSQFDLANMNTAEVLLADATGDSAIVERHAITYRAKGIDFQIATNFRTSQTPADQITCDRYKVCQTQLSKAKTPTIKGLEDLLNQTKADSPSPYKTWYSVICNLKRQQVRLYRKGDFGKPTPFNLHSELEKGPRRLDMDDFIAQLGH